jgi:hypothetical protein
MIDAYLLTGNNLNIVVYDFRIYPGGITGTDTGLTTGRPDEPALIQQALAQLRPPGRNFITGIYSL